VPRRLLPASANPRLYARPDPEGRMQVDAPKAADRNRCQQIIRPSRGMRAGLKILVSAVQSRPSPPFFQVVLEQEFGDRDAERDLLQASQLCNTLLQHPLVHDGVAPVDRLGLVAHHCHRY
jgi:hypothetical protein